MTNSADESVPADGTPGPFEVAASSDQPGGQPPLPPQSQDITGPTTDQSEYELERRIDCSNYSECLNLAAALNWQSFTCSGCAGEINQSLRWRAAHSTKRDALAQAICGRVNLGK